MAFKVFENLLYTGRPSPVHAKIERMHNINSGSLYVGGILTQGLPDQGLVETEAQSAAVLAAGPTFMDIEHWPIDRPSADPATQAAVEAQAVSAASKFATTIGWFKAVAPTETVGFYGYAPTNHYDDSIFAENDARHIGWHTVNDLMANMYSLLDMCLPSLYRHHDQNQWLDNAKAQIAEARRVAPGKPVYPFLWPQDAFAPNNYISVSDWRQMLDVCRDKADGVVLWGGYQQAWDANAPWWLETLDFLTNVPNFQRLRKR